MHRETTGLLRSRKTTRTAGATMVAAIVLALAASGAYAAPTTPDAGAAGTRLAQISLAEYGGWYSSQAGCAAAGRDYVRLNGASGFSCRSSGAGFDLWVSY